MGDNTQLSSVSRTLAKLYSAIAVNIAYRLAPAHNFPTAAYDTHDTIIWLSKNASSLGAELSKGFILLGASAGANLAAVTSQKWVSTRSSPPITGVSLAVPWLLSSEIVPEEYKDLWLSREQDQDAMILNKAAIAYMMAAYEPDVHSPEFSPFNTPRAHRGLPLVHIQVCGSDPLRDDGLLYEKVLRDHGVKTRMEVYPGVPHGFSLFRGLPLAKRSFFDEILAIGWLIGDEKTEEDIEQLLPDDDYLSI
jgi:acetyl esterase/lipase